MDRVYNTSMTPKTAKGRSREHCEGWKPGGLSYPFGDGFYLPFLAIFRGWLMICFIIYITTLFIELWHVTCWSRLGDTSIFFPRLKPLAQAYCTRHVPVYLAWRPLAVRAALWLLWLLWLRNGPVNVVADARPFVTTRPVSWSKTVTQILGSPSKGSIHPFGDPSLIRSQGLKDPFEYSSIL